MDRTTALRIARRTAVTCARGVSRALLAPFGIPLFVITLVSLVTVPIGIGVWLAPKALLTVRGVAQRQRGRGRSR
jgi:hypothetical protein